MDDDRQDAPRTHSRGPAIVCYSPDDVSPSPIANCSAYRRRGVSPVSRARAIDRSPISPVLRA